MRPEPVMMAWGPSPSAASPATTSEPPTPQVASYLDAGAALRCASSASSSSSSTISSSSSSIMSNGSDGPLGGGGGVGLNNYMPSTPSSVASSSATHYGNSNAGGGMAGEMMMLPPAINSTGFAVPAVPMAPPPFVSMSSSPIQPGPPISIPMPASYLPYPSSRAALPFPLDSRVRRGYPASFHSSVYPYVFDDDRSDAATVGTSVAGNDPWEDDVEDEGEVAGFEAVKRWTLRVNSAKPDPVVEDPGVNPSPVPATSSAAVIAAMVAKGAASGSSQLTQPSPTFQVRHLRAPVASTSAVAGAVLDEGAGVLSTSTMADIVIERPTRSPSPPAAIDPEVLARLVKAEQPEYLGMTLDQLSGTGASDTVLEHLRGPQEVQPDVSASHEASFPTSDDQMLVKDIEDGEEPQDPLDDEDEDEDDGHDPTGAASARGAAGSSAAAAPAPGSTSSDWGWEEENDINGLPTTRNEPGPSNTRGRSRRESLRVGFEDSSSYSEGGGFEGVASAAEPPASDKVFSEDAEDAFKRDEEDEDVLPVDWIIPEEEPEGASAGVPLLRNLPKRALIQILIYSGNPNLLKTCRRLCRLPLPELGHDLAQLVVAFTRMTLARAPPSKASTSDAPTLVLGASTEASSSTSSSAESAVSSALASDSSHSANDPSPRYERLPPAPAAVPIQLARAPMGGVLVPTPDPAVLLPRCARAACLDRSPFTLPCLARLLGPAFNPTADTLGAVMEIAARGKRWNTVRGALALARRAQDMSRWARARNQMGGSRLFEPSPPKKMALLASDLDAQHRRRHFVPQLDTARTPGGLRYVLDADPEGGVARGLHISLVANVVANHGAQLDVAFFRDLIEEEGIEFHEDVLDHCAKNFNLSKEVVEYLRERLRMMEAAEAAARRNDEAIEAMDGQFVRFGILS
ncbi:hypothetical protein HDU96_009410 [Phlyctochytrium bullatum]|nr:hypothetical protein HDU96_009410 [Phlyctochytrium bullatum]